jgi:hypothetical protein
MFRCDTKFENLEEVLGDLQSILKNSLQSGVLDIKSINKDGEKYKGILAQFPQLQDAEHVIYSSYMRREYHESEKFIFIDATGHTVCTLTGRDLDLYDMIKKCDMLKESKRYH